MQFEVVTIFRELFPSFLQGTLLGKAIEAGTIRVDFTDPRDFAEGKHRSVDVDDEATSLEGAQGANGRLFIG